MRVTRRCRYLSTVWDTDIGIWCILAWLPVAICFFVCRHFHSRTDAGTCVHQRLPPLHLCHIMRRYARAEVSFKDKDCKDKCFSICQALALLLFVLPFTFSFFLNGCFLADMDSRFYFDGGALGRTTPIVVGDTVYSNGQAVNSDCSSSGASPNCLHSRVHVACFNQTYPGERPLTEIPTYVLFTDAFDSSMSMIG